MIVFVVLLYAFPVVLLVSGILLIRYRRKCPKHQLMWPRASIWWLITGIALILVGLLFLSFLLVDVKQCELRDAQSNCLEPD